MGHAKFQGGSIISSGKNNSVPSLSCSQRNVATCIVSSLHFYSPYDVSLYLLNKRESQTLGNREYFLSLLRIQAQENQNGLNTRLHKHHRAEELKKTLYYSEEVLSSILISFAVLNTVYLMCCRQQTESFKLHFTCIFI